MEFTLHYRGDLKANRGPKDKQVIRRHFHSQLKLLWQQLPLSEHRTLLGENQREGDVSIFKQVGNFNFAPLVCQKLNLVAELSITLLRPEAPGSLITQGGDIDNRLKTLFDALTMPIQASQIPQDDLPSVDETPFFCLLEDDNLIIKVSVATDRLLEPCKSTSEVEMNVHVRARPTRQSWANMGLGS